MKYASICIALALIVATCFPGQATSEPKQSDADSAAQLFKAGKFTEAGDIYARIAAQDPKDYSAVLQLGRVALLANRLDDAQRWFEAAIALRPSDDDAKVMLAETFYRRDDFQKAAAALDGVEVGSNRLIIEQYPTLNVAKLESFKGQTPYEVHGDGQTTRLKFLKTPSLPVVSVRVNGGDEVNFFIDTGGSELGLDTEFAKELGLPQFGDVQGTFSGGEQAKVGQSRIERSSSATGPFEPARHDAALSPILSRTWREAHRRRDRHHSLLPFPGDARFSARRARAPPQKRGEPQGVCGRVIRGNSVAVPFWIASDHFMVGWGRVETIPPALLFVDTGLAGAGVKLAEPVIKEAGIKLEEDKASEGAGQAER